jgi:hypothetical protein
VENSAFIVFVQGIQGPQNLQKQGQRRLRENNGNGSNGNCMHMSLIVDFAIKTAVNNQGRHIDSK